MRNRLLLAAALATIATGAPLQAQTVHTGTTRTTTTAKATTGAAAGTVVVPNAPARIAGIAPPPPVFLIVSGDQGFFTPIGGATVVFADIPAIVVGDGRVFANFGRGVEQVIRPCGTLLNTSGELFVSHAQPAVAQPVVIQPTPGASQPLPFTPNVPNQPTISQQMLTQAFVTGPVFLNTTSCFAANRVGQVFVTRP